MQIPTQGIVGIYHSGIAKDLPPQSKIFNEPPINCLPHPVLDILKQENGTCKSPIHEAVIFAQRPANTLLSPGGEDLH